MTSECEGLDPFLDGELSEPEAAAFRRHLAECATCREEITHSMVVGALYRSVLPAAGEDSGGGGDGGESIPAGAAPPVLRIVDGGGEPSGEQAHGGDPLPAPTPAPTPEGRPTPSRLGRLQRDAVVALSALSLAAGLAVIVRGAPTGDGGRGAGHGKSASRRVKRPIQARVNGDGSDYHPYAIELGGGAGSDEPPTEETADLTRRLIELHDFDRAIRLLDEARKSSPDAIGPLSDLAAVAVERQDWLAALTLTSRVLAIDPHHPQALWNRGLAAVSFGLDLFGARSFEEVAALKEPGWSSEAANRAAKARRDAESLRADWLAADRAGAALVASGTPVPEAIVNDFPGLTRLYFYDALRTAPDATHVRALGGLADRLDERAQSDVLRHAVDRLASADFVVRAPLGAVYRDLLRRTRTLDGAALGDYLARLAQARQPDLLLGALYRTDAAVDRPDEYSSLARQSGDPWFLALSGLVDARARSLGGDLPGAESRLLEELRNCQTRHLPYRCIALQARLAEVYRDLHQPTEARRHAVEAWRRARELRDWAYQVELLQRLAEVARFDREDYLAATILEEAMLRNGVEKSCAVDAVLRVQRADIELNRGRATESRAELAPLERPCPTSPPQIGVADLLAKLAHWGPGPTDERRVRAILAVHRASTASSPGLRVLADAIEGRFEIESGEPRGRQHLTEAIAAADRLPRWDAMARYARAQAYTALIMSAGRSGDHRAALELMANELAADASGPSGRPATPDRCLIGITTWIDQILVSARGADGAVLGQFEDHHTGPVDTAELIPDDIRGAMAGCPRVDVMARPPVQGDTRLNLDGMAWSYRVVGAPTAATTVHATAPKRVVVSQIEISPSAPEGLRSLGPWSSRLPLAGRDRELTGPQATPSGVLAAIRDATEIDFLTHGVLDPQVSDVSFLVLSEESDSRRYRLTAAEVRKQKLEGHPLVILAACRAGESKQYWNESWGLPAAFLEAGAAAVLASPSTLTSDEAGAFIDDLRETLRTGVDPAVALRDTKERWAREKGNSTVAQVLLFQ